MSDSIIIRGFVATEITSSTTPGGVATASFRLGSTARRFDRESKVWTDGHTNWYTVQGYRNLAGTLGCSIRKGQPVIVIGKLKVRTWEKDGRMHHSTIVDAEAVGHDLTFGSANFIRTAARPALSLVEHPPAGDDDPGMDDVLDEPDDRRDDLPEDPGRPAVVIQDNDGALASLDLDTGELAEV
jgi:single-strand DNA-binding protein